MKRKPLRPISEVIFFRKKGQNPNACKVKRAYCWYTSNYAPSISAHNSRGEKGMYLGHWSTSLAGIILPLGDGDAY